MSFKRWWSNNMNLGHVVSRKLLKGTDLEGQSFGKILQAVLKPISAKLFDTEMTKGQEQRAALEMSNQQILNEEEFQRKKMFYEEYESPEAMMRQYKSAGLNPALMFGGSPSISASGGIGSAGDVGQPSQAGTDNPLSAILSPILGILKFGVEKKVADSEMSLKGANAGMLKASTTAQNIENEYKRQLYELDIEQKRRDIEKTGTEIDINLQTLEKLSYDTEFSRIYAIYAPDLFDVQLAQGYSNESLNRARAYRESIEAEVSEARKKEIDSVVAKNNAEARQFDANCRKINEEIRLIGSQIGLTDQQKMESEQRIRNLQEENNLLGKKIGLTQKEIDWYAANHTEVVAYDHEDTPLNPGVTYKDKSGVYTVHGNGKVTYKRPFHPNSAASKK